VYSLLVVVLDVLAEKPPQVLLVDHDHVIEQLSPDGPDPALCDPVLPRASIRRSFRLDAEVLDRLGDSIREGPMVVMGQESDGLLVGKRLTELLDRP
jgi:hypothetical protein